MLKRGDVVRYKKGHKNEGVTLLITKNSLEPWPAYPPLNSEVLMYSENPNANRISSSPDVTDEEVDIIMPADILKEALVTGAGSSVVQSLVEAYERHELPFIVFAPAHTKETYEEEIRRRYGIGR